MTKHTVIRICLIGVAVVSIAIGAFAAFYTKAHDIVVDPQVFFYLAMAGWASVIVTNLLARRRKSQPRFKACPPPLDRLTAAPRFATLPQNRWEATP